jgi:MFS family permease
VPAPTIFTRTFLIAAGGNFLFFTGLAGFFLLPLHLQALGASETAIGVVMGCHTGAAIVAQPLVGIWVDRGRRRRFLWQGAALAGAAAAAFAVVPERLPLLALLRLAQGLGFSLYFVANLAVVVDAVPPDRRGRALGVFGISGLLSGALGPVLAEAVVRAVGFRAFFLAAAGLAVAAGAPTATLPEPRPGPPPAGEGLAGLARAVREGRPTTMALAVAFGLGLGVVFTFVPTFARSLGVARVAPFALAYSAAALLVRAAGAGLVDTLGRRAVIVPALAVQAAGAALLAVTAAAAGSGALPVQPFLAAAGFLAGAAHGFLYPALTAMVVDVAPPERRGRLLGVFSAFILAGQAAGAMAFGPVAHGLGYGPMFAVLAAILGGAVGLARRLDR